LRCCVGFIQCSSHCNARQELLATLLSNSEYAYVRHMCAMAANYTQHNASDVLSAQQISQQVDVGQT
jgi:hypothetical protein